MGSSIVGSVDKYCPHCGSENVFKIELHLEPVEDSTLEFEGDNTLWYECGDCHSEWEQHQHHATHMNYGRA